MLMHLHCHQLREERFCCIEGRGGGRGSRCVCNESGLRFFYCGCSSIYNRRQAAQVLWIQKLHAQLQPLLLWKLER